MYVTLRQFSLSAQLAQILQSQTGFCVQSVIVKEERCVQSVIVKQEPYVQSVIVKQEHCVQSVTVKNKPQ